MPYVTPQTAHFDPEDIQDIATFLHMPADAVEARLRAFDRAEIADAWTRANPVTPADQHRFYATTDLYIWELMQWHSSDGYAEYWHAIDALTHGWPSRDFPRVLDYGCGIGSVALRLAAQGYQVTLADVAGRTLDFARWRFARRNLSAQVVALAVGIPPALAACDLLVCFDVLEHIPDPDKVLFRLARAVRPGGGAAIQVAFHGVEDYPQHLAANVQRFGLTGNWWLYMNTAGFDSAGDKLYRKVARRRLLFRYLRFHLWQRTGWCLVRVPHHAASA